MSSAGTGVSWNGFEERFTNRLTSRLWRCMAGLMLAFVSVCQADANDLEGTWRLVKRELPDGTIQAPPTVQGLFTITKGLEQTIVYWSTPSGKPASLAQIDRLEVSDTEVVATPVLVVFDDGSGKPPVYMVGGETKRSPVTRRGARVSYQHPTHPPFVVWEGDKLTATLQGAFTDYWEKLK